MIDCRQERRSVIAKGRTLRVCPLAHVAAKPISHRLHVRVVRLWFFAPLHQHCSCKTVEFPSNAPAYRE